MAQYLVTEPSSKIRSIARGELRGKWQQAIIAFLIVFVVQDVVAMILNYFFAFSRTIYTVWGPVEQNIGLVGDLFTFAVGGAFSYGIALFLLTMVRTRETNNSLVFEGFSRFSKVFILSLIIAIKVFLWTLLLIVPGIIAMIRYSMAYYILADNPEYTPTECIEESKRLMNGNKAKYFCLNLSFIGWYILAAIASSFFIRDRETIGEILIYSILYIPVIAADVYRSTSVTVLYEMINGNIVLSDGTVYEAQFQQKTYADTGAETRNVYSQAADNETQAQTAKYSKETSDAYAKKPESKNGSSALDSFGAPIDEKDDL